MIDARMLNTEVERLEEQRKETISAVLRAKMEKKSLVARLASLNGAIDVLKQLQAFAVREEAMLAQAKANEPKTEISDANKKVQDEEQARQDTLKSLSVEDIAQMVGGKGATGEVVPEVVIEQYGEDEDEQ